MRGSALERVARDPDHHRRPRVSEALPVLDERRQRAGRRRAPSVTAARKSLAYGTISGFAPSLSRTGETSRAREEHQRPEREPQDEARLRIRETVVRRAFAHRMRDADLHAAHPAVGHRVREVHERGRHADAAERG